MKIKLLMLVLISGLIVAACSNNSLQEDPVRDTGYPTSRNGASSLHLLLPLSTEQMFPILPTEQMFTEISVTLKIEKEPQVNDIYFWAISADFYDESLRVGMGHLGLYLGDTTARDTSYFPYSHGTQWTGYKYPTDAPYRITSFPDDNNVDYSWKQGGAYRLTIKRTSDNPKVWSGYVSDLNNSKTILIGTLNTGGTLMGGVVGVWSEIFAQCNSPSTSVTWSDFEGITEDGTSVKINAFRVNYPKHYSGGCTNTNSELINSEIRQTTNIERKVKQGTIIYVP